MIRIPFLFLDGDPHGIGTDGDPQMPGTRAVPHGVDSPR